MDRVKNIKKFTVKPEEEGLRLDKFLAAKILSFPLAQKLTRKKLVKINNHKVVDAGHKLQIGDVIEVILSADFVIKKTGKKPAKKISPADLEKVKATIIFEDENLFVLNKPSGMAVQGGSGIKFCIDDALPFLKNPKDQTPRLVHRLDKDTSGILLIAKNRQAADFLTEAFRNKTIHKEYVALVKGLPSKASGTINIPLLKKHQGKNEKIYRDENGKEAITNYQLLFSNEEKNFSLLLLQPITGRTHQLRVHCKEIGHPIIGDYKYGDREYNDNFYYSRNIDGGRLCLHSTKITIDDFFGQQLSITTHPDLKRPLDYLQIFRI